MTLQRFPHLFDPKVYNQRWKSSKSGRQMQSQTGAKEGSDTSQSKKRD